MVDFTCECGFKTQVRDDLVGKKVKCPSCGRVVILPSFDGSSQHTSYDERETQAKREEYPRSPGQIDSEKKSRTKWYALIGGVLVIAVVGIGILALNWEPRLPERNNRDETYNQYLQKSEAFFDSVYRTSSDLEVGINHQKFQERIQDMNFQYNKWAESLTAEEKLYPSARLLEATLNCYLKSQTHWQSKIDTQNKTHAQWSETCMQNEWGKARVMLSWAKECRQMSDLVEGQHCILCEGDGELSCPVCNSTGKCPICKGAVNYSIPCLSCKETGDCSFCGGDGSTNTRCLRCEGNGKCFLCKGTGNSYAMFACSECKGTGNCSYCEGAGSYNTTCSICEGTGKCSSCRGTGQYNTHCGQCFDGRCRECLGKGTEECPVCAGSGSFPPQEKNQ